jgi:hypothetical protein
MTFSARTGCIPAGQNPRRVTPISYHQCIATDVTLYLVKPGAQTGSSRAFGQYSLRRIEPTWPDPEAPQQAHFDFAVADLEVAKEAALGAGATTTATQPSPERRRVMRDPAGHPFCLTTLIAQ